MSVYYRTLLDTTSGSTYVNAIIAYANSQGWTIPSSGTISAMVTLVNSLVSSGIWNKLDIFYMFGYNDTSLSNFSRINWINPGTFNITNISTTILPSYNTNGFFKVVTGTDTNLLNTGFNPSVNAINLTLDDISVGMYGYETYDVAPGGTTDFFSTYEVISSLTYNFISYGMKTFGGGPKIPPTYGSGYTLNGSQIGGPSVLDNNLKVFVREASTDISSYSDGILFSTVANTSTSLPNTPVLLFRNSSSVYNTTLYMSLFFIGSSLNSTENDDMNTYITNFRTTIGL